MRTNIPTESRMKNRRLKQREPIDATCWAFMRFVRSRYKGQRVYDENPYVEVYPIHEGVYALLSESLDGAGDVWMYLLVGEEKAMLIDTGFGLGDLKGLCDRLSGGRELIVANTHPHIDHATGNFQFDRVYCHEYAVPTLQNMMTPHAWNRLYDAEGRKPWADFPDEDLIPFRKYEIIGVPDGYCFRLGADQEVELIFTAGHASGHCMFLDKKSRFLFAGDDVISMRIGIGGPRPDDPYGRYATVTEYCRQMKKLAARMDEYDFVFPGHFVFGLENYVIQDLAEAAQEIIEHPEQYDFEETAVNGRGEVQHRMQKYVHGLGTIAYTEQSV